jgi:chromosome segregation ATPase
MIIEITTSEGHNVIDPFEDFENSQVKYRSIDRQIQNDVLILLTQQIKLKDSYIKAVEENLQKAEVKILELQKQLDLSKIELQKIQSKLVEEKEKRPMTPSELEELSHKRRRMNTEW